MTNNKLEWFYSIIRLLKYFFIRINNSVSNKVLIKIIIAELMFLMILRIEYNALNITSIISNIITVSGIFAGIVIAYLSSKIFQIRGEREQWNAQTHCTHLQIAQANPQTKICKRVQFCQSSNDLIQMNIVI